MLGKKRACKCLMIRLWWQEHQQRRVKKKSKLTETSKKEGKQAQEQSKQSKVLRVRRLGFGKEAAKDEQRWELGKRKETKRRKAPQDYTSYADACGGGWYTREWRPRPCGSCPCPPSRIPRPNAPLCVCVCFARWLLLRSLSGSQVSRGERRLHSRSIQMTLHIFTVHLSSI